MKVTNSTAKNDEVGVPESMQMLTSCVHHVLLGKCQDVRCMALMLRLLTFYCNCKQSSLPYGGKLEHHVESNLQQIGATNLVSTLNHGSVCTEQLLLACMPTWLTARC